MSATDKQAFRKNLNQSIDYDAVLKQIASFASFSRSKEEILSSMPDLGLLEMKQALALAAEGLEIERMAIHIPFGGITDISREVEMARRKMTLSSVQLNTIGSFLSAVKAIASCLKLDQTPMMKDLAESMDPCEKLAASISAMIDISGQVKKDATPKLASLNRQLLERRQAFAVQVKNFIKANSSKLMDTITTSISGRTCVLVKAQDKNAFRGMIHGQSQSGMAFYVEPQSFVSANNAIQETVSAIEEEEACICRELSAKVSAKADAILSDLDTITLIDAAMTKARWAMKYDGCIPVITGRAGLKFIHARHPLIDVKKAVPNDYILSQEQNCLMISGPNMGGKSVTLKTIGLFVTLAHAGFPVIAHQAVIPRYESLWFDIGDQQSIENSLSTFSGHMQKISMIVKHAGEHAFVLLDEVGNGTDPAQGASLAVALLENLIAKKATIITSTHYNEVKAFGKSSPQVLVSSVEFDPQTLRPTYKYIPGVSGASYAYSIADAFGLDPSIIERAKILQKENESELEKQLRSLEVEQNKVRKDQERFKALIADAHRVQKEALQEKEKWEKKKDRLDAEYEEKLNALLEKKEQEAQQLFDSMKERGAIKLHEKNELIASLKELAPEQEIQEAEETIELKVGDYARIEGLNLHGQILDIKKNKATLLSSGKKTTVSLSSLTPISQPEKQKKPKSERTDKVFTRFPLELNIIGMRVEEGLRALDHYLDQAVYHKVKQVRIIHGMGTGKLRNAVWQDLKTRNSVKSYTSGGPAEGGLGATIVYLK